MYQRILIVVEAGSASRAAITEGVALAKAYGAEVLFFSVLPRYVVPVVDMPMAGELSPEAFQRSTTSAAERHLAAVSTVAEQAGVPSRYAVGSGADDAECIFEEAKRKRCGLIVVASAGRNALMRLLMGSVLPGLITVSTIPVLVVRKPSRGNKARRLGPSLAQSLDDTKRQPEPEPAAAGLHSVPPGQAAQAPFSQAAI